MVSTASNPPKKKRHQANNTLNIEYKSPGYSKPCSSSEMWYPETYIK
jgi:hypothetical protein